MIDGELASMRGGYMPNRYFNFKDYELQFWVQTTFPQHEWYPRLLVDDKNKVTKSAIYLSERVFKELNIKLFPLIITTAIKGYGSDGQYKFMMYGKGLYDVYYFDHERAKYNLKSMRLACDYDGSNNIISLTSHPH